MNNVTLIGNLTRDPESMTVGDTTVCKFSIAINKKVSTKSGEQKEVVVFPDIEVWGRTGENCQKYLSKGSKAAILGELAQSSWETKEGDKRTKLFVKAYNVEFLSTNNAQSSSEDAPKSSKRVESKPIDDFEDDFGDSEDVPF